MVSCWTNHLGFSQISEDLWRIGTYGYNWLGSIYDLVPEDQLYDEAPVGRSNSPISGQVKLPHLNGL